MTLTKGTILGMAAMLLLPFVSPSDCTCQRNQALTETSSSYSVIQEDSLVDKVKSLFEERSEAEIETISKFADEYMKRYLPSKPDQHTVNVLYPGSGVDTKQLLMGLKFLHQSEVERVNFVYTEVGDEAVAWYPGKEELKSSLEVELDKYVRAGLLEPKGVKVTPFAPVISEGKEMDSVEIKYFFDVNTEKGKKNLTLTVAYNRAGNRAEPSTEEVNFFGQDFMEKVREEGKSYWPLKIKPDTLYPMYATDQQFSNADIVLSRMCGDHNLLEFDYLRAMLSPTVEIKPRVILDEYGKDNFAIRKSLPQYETRILQIGGSYGYNSSQFNQTGDEIGIVALTPKVR